MKTFASACDGTRAGRAPTHTFRQSLRSTAGCSSFGSFFAHGEKKTVARCRLVGWAAVVCPRMATGQGPLKADARGQWRDVTSEMRAAAQGLSIQAKTTLVPQSAAHSTFCTVHLVRNWSAGFHLVRAHLGLASLVCADKCLNKRVQCFASAHTLCSASVCCLHAECA
jgi:hypothetical protein